MQQDSLPYQPDRHRSAHVHSNIRLRLTSVDLFRIVTVRGEIIIGITKRDYAGLHGRDVSAIARALSVEGAITLLQYAVRKADDGELELAPRQRVSILRHDSLRVEPYATPLRVLAAPDEGIERDPPPRC